MNDGSDHHRARGLWRLRVWGARRVTRYAVAVAALVLVAAVVLARGEADATLPADSSRTAETGNTAAPEAEVVEVVGRGVASYYGAGLAGHPTASGEPFDPTELTAAHRTLPLGSRVRVTNLRNDETVTVRINDRGPFYSSRILDLSRRAAERIGMVARGEVRVKVELLEDG